ncbi:MAG: hypothetical protein P4L40_13825, partial [Terracidiphilus sp.]|nr:hypothetical protein [Terracidiphilus sp.]
MWFLCVCVCVCVCVCASKSQLRLVCIPLIPFSSQDEQLRWATDREAMEAEVAVAARVRVSAEQVVAAMEAVRVAEAGQAAAESKAAEAHNAMTSSHAREKELCDRVEELCIEVAGLKEDNARLRGREEE